MGTSQLYEGNCVLHGSALMIRLADVVGKISMKRPQLNFLVDAASFVSFLLLLSTGLLLRYQLPAGSGRLEGYGTGRGESSRLITLLWGWTRHEWGEIHFWIAVTLVTVLAMHLFLHWKWIVCVVRGTQSQASGWRFGLGLSALVALLVLAAMPLIVPTERATRQQLLQDSPPREEATDFGPRRGSMTLQEVAAERGMSVQNLRESLGLTDSASPEAHIGPLLRESGQRMSDLDRLLTKRAEADALREKETKP